MPRRPRHSHQAGVARPARQPCLPATAHGPCWGIAGAAMSLLRGCWLLAVAGRDMIARHIPIWHSGPVRARAPARVQPGSGGVKAGAWEIAGTRARAAATSASVDLGHDQAGLARAFRQYIAPWADDQGVAIGRPAILCGPPWAGEITKHPVSMARARSRTCQWARPVVSVKAEGTASSSAPACARLR